MTKYEKPVVETFAEVDLCSDPAMASCTDEN